MVAAAAQVTNHLGLRVMSPPCSQLSATDMLLNSELQLTRAPALHLRYCSPRGEGGTHAQHIQAQRSTRTQTHTLPYSFYSPEVLMPLRLEYYAGY